MSAVLITVSVAVAAQRGGGSSSSVASDVQATVTETVGGAPVNQAVSQSATASRSEVPSAGSPVTAGATQTATSSASSSAAGTSGTTSDQPHGPAAPTHPMTAKPTVTPSAVAAPYVIHATAVLTLGQSITWGKGTLSMTSGGDLELTDEKGGVRWAAHTSGSDLRTYFQDDGLLAVYDAGYNVKWSSHTDGNPGADLVMTADGNLQIRLNGAVLWQTGTGH
ncbi:hypothetical protein ACFY8K_35665 [Streptomyces misionensis]|uniref:hypothetical protein n=1 Tax=Streptomyces misionensis TaxID=67331 RepID=UPI00367BF084